MSLPRALLVFLVLAAVGACGIAATVAAGSVERDQSAGATGSTDATVMRTGDEAIALGVLREWDARRSAAWEAGDLPRLRALYTVGSRAGDRDVAMLSRWRERGVDVREMQTQVLALNVSVATENRLVLRLTDRLARAVAVEHGRRVVLPDDRASTRVVTLRRPGLAGAPWRVASVVPAT